MLGAWGRESGKEGQDTATLLHMGRSILRLAVPRGGGKVLVWAGMVSPRIFYDF